MSSSIGVSSDALAMLVNSLAEATLEIDRLEASEAESAKVLKSWQDSAESYKSLFLEAEMNFKNVMTDLNNTKADLRRAQDSLATAHRKISNLEAESIING